LKEGGWLLFEFDLVVAVVDVDGSEFAEHIFAEESVEVGAQNVAEAIEIHDGDAAGEPCTRIIDWTVRNGR
jgi:hypothetical protein